MPVSTAREDAEKEIRIPRSHAATYQLSWFKNCVSASGHSSHPSNRDREHSCINTCLFQVASDVTGWLPAGYRKPLAYEVALLSVASIVAERGGRLADAGPQAPGEARGAEVEKKHSELRQPWPPNLSAALSGVLRTG